MDRMYAVWSLFRARDEACGPGTSVFEVTIKLDNNPNETNWQLGATDGSFYLNQEREGFEVTLDKLGGSTLQYDICLQNGKQYSFSIFDSAGNGLSNAGNYSISLNGAAIREGASFGGEETTMFSIPADGPTSVPIIASPPPTPFPTRGVLPEPNPVSFPTPFAPFAPYTPSSPFLLAPSPVGDFFPPLPPPSPESPQNQPIVVITPEQVPTDAPIQKIEFPPGFCFSANPVVQVEQKGQTLMKDLHVGDNVHVGNGKFEPVYTFAHRDVETEAVFLRFMPSQLELSKDHMVFVEGKGPVPASMVMIGDRFSNGELVQAITQVTRVGVFSPFTPSGKIIVNGIEASNYVAFQGTENMMIGPIKTPFSYQWLAHSYQAPHRFWCYWLGKEDRASMNGFSVWIEPALKFANWFVGQTAFVMGMLLIPYVVLMVALNAFESLLIYPNASLCFGAVMIMATSWLCNRRQKI